MRRSAESAMETAMTEQTAIPVTIPSVPHKGKFFILEPSFWGNGQSPGLSIANEEKLLTPRMNTMDPPNGDADQYAERPHLVHVPKLGGMPRDFEELAGIWIVSEALKQVFESVDPAGFAFAACDFSLADGSPGPRYYLCEVVRSLDALNEEASRVKIKYERDHQTGEDLKFFSIRGGASLVFEPGIVGDAHIFRQERLGAGPVCDRTMFDALNDAHLSGVELSDATQL